MIIECTKKLSEAMKINLVPYDETKADPFYEWHANLFMLYRRKGVLLMNNNTRYCIVLYGYDRSVLGQMKEFDISISWEIEDHILRYTINLVSLNH